MLAEIVWPHFRAVQIILLVLIAMERAMHELLRVIGKARVLWIFLGPIPVTLVVVRKEPEPEPEPAEPEEEPTPGSTPRCASTTRT